MTNCRPAVKRHLSQPPDYWIAWQNAANRERLTLSEWVAECCNANLTLTQQRTLPRRRRRGENN